MQPIRERNASKAKPMQIKNSKIACIGYQPFFGIGTFQGVTGESNKKNPLRLSSRLGLCAETPQTLVPLFLLTGRRARRGIYPASRKFIPRILDSGKELQKPTGGSRFGGVDAAITARCSPSPQNGPASIMANDAARGRIRLLLGLEPNPIACLRRARWGENGRADTPK
jgi:hypothetical protein